MTRIGRSFKPLMWLMAMLLPALVAGCGGGGDSAAPAAAAPNPAGAVCTQGAACVDLATAGTYVILAQAAITNTGTSAVTGNIGMSPNPASSITGFALSTPPTTFTTSAQVTGQVFASDYDPPTPANLTTAVSDSIAAYTAAQGKTSTAGCPGTGTFDGTVVPPLAPGVYTCGVNVTIPTNFTLNGTATDVWVFQLSGTLSQSAATQVLLTGGALAKNVFWAVAGATDIGNGAHFEGIILSPSNIALVTGASMNGRLYSGTGVALDGNIVTRP